MPTYYVEDYEALTGNKPEDAPAEPTTEAKVVEPAAKKAPAKKTSAAKTKA